MAEDDTPRFRTTFDPAYGSAVDVAPMVQRLVAENPSPFTFHGTNTYLLGERSVAVIDPGPAIDAHYDALVAAIGGRNVSHIIVTHTHMDHSPLAARLKAETGAAVYAEGPHRAARELAMGELNPLDASADTDFAPDVVVKDGDTISGDEWALNALHTPGHTENHMAFALQDTDWLFSGDHVMAWATSIVAPPDGSMAHYMASLDHLLAQPQTKYLPGHGGRLENAHAFTRAIKTHRRMRERAVLEQVRSGVDTIPAIVATIYASTDKRLHGAAGLSVLAHLEDLVGRGLIITEGTPRLESSFQAA